MSLADEINGDCYRMVGRIEGKRVADVGAANGLFTRWAIEHDAVRVDAYEPDLDLWRQTAYSTVGLPVVPHWRAVTRFGGSTTVVPHGFGVRVEAGGTSCLAVAWPSVLTEVVKADCEGCEYDLIGVDLHRVEYLGMEFHRWATPERPVEGLGLRNYPQERTPEQLAEWLDRTHHVTVNGNLAAGGYMYAVRR